MYENERTLVEADIRFGVGVLGRIYLGLIGIWSLTSCLQYGIIGLLWACLSICLLIQPLVIYCYIGRSMTKRTSLRITEKNIYAVYNSFFVTNTLQMPIEKIDTIVVLSGISSKLKGSIVEIRVASSKIKIGYVRNADEITETYNSLASRLNNKNVNIGMVESVKNNSVTDRLKELSSLREQGIITEEEYSKKKEKIISEL